MKGLLIFEKRIRKSTAGHYYDSMFTDAVLSRYTSVVDELYLVVRADKLDMPEAEIERKYSRITLPSVHVVEIGNVLSPSGLRKFFPMRRRILDCIKSVDVVFVRIPTIWQQLVSRWAAKMGKTCILEVGADVFATYWQEGFFGKLLALGLEWNTRHVVGNASHVVYVTEKWLQDKYPTRGVSCACSNVDIVAQPDAVLTRRLGKIRDMAAPVHLGTLASVSTRSKGQDTVIKALSALKARGRCDFVYHLAGAGNPSRLRRLANRLGIQDNVRFDGLVRHDQIGEWFRSIDLYVQPSRQEGLPRALVEAMSYALPALGARTGGIPELLPPSCIFDHSSNPVRQICVFLESLAPDTLLRLAQANFEKAAGFASRVLEPRRHAFFLSAIQGAST